MVCRETRPGRAAENIVEHQRIAPGPMPVDARSRRTCGSWCTPGARATGDAEGQTGERSATGSCPATSPGRYPTAPAPTTLSGAGRAHAEEVPQRRVPGGSGRATGARAAARASRRRRRRRVSSAVRTRATRLTVDHACDFWPLMRCVARRSPSSAMPRRHRTRRGGRGTQASSSHPGPDGVQTVTDGNLTTSLTRRGSVGRRATSPRRARRPRPPRFPGAGRGGRRCRGPHPGRRPRSG